MDGDADNHQKNLLELSLDQKIELADALFACQQVGDPEVRDTMIDLLPPEIKGRIRRHSSGKTHVISIVNACASYQYPDSIEKLLKIVFTFEENSDAWQRLFDLWSHIRPPKCQNVPLSEISKIQIPIVSEDYSRVGEHICIDRRWECATFDHMRARDGRVSQRVMAFQVPGGQGKSMLLKRFDFFCETDVIKNGKKLLYARIDFRDRPLQPASLVSEILRSFVENIEANTQKLSPSNQLSAETVIQLKESFGNIQQSLGELRSKVQHWSHNFSQTAPSEDQLLELASEMHKFCRSIAPQWTVVLLFDTFEDAGNAGTWFLRYCIPKIVDMDNVIVVLGGREGLTPLASRHDQVLFRGTLEPMKYRDDCQRLAELKYGLKISDEVAEMVIHKYDGDLQQIDMALTVMRDFPGLMKTDA